MFDRKVYFDYVRTALFSGTMTQQQVDGQEAILGVWEGLPEQFPEIDFDDRWLAYMLATAYHETAQAMWPVEESGKGAGHPYGEVDPETKQAYYGRGFVQLTWRENYAKADRELGTTCERNASLALDPEVAAAIMFKGMYEGWFREDSLPIYFNEEIDDDFNAREIINGDKNVVPEWSNGTSIGYLIQGYHQEFLEALTRAWRDDVPTPGPTPEVDTVYVDVDVGPVPVGLRIVVRVNGEECREAGG